MLIARNPSKPIRYVLSCDRDRAEDDAARTVFEVTLLSVLDEEELWGKVLHEQGSAAAATYALRKHLRGWTNLPNDEGGQVLLERGDDGLVTMECLNWIPREERSELAELICYRPEGAAKRRQELGLPVGLELKGGA